jgi:hypothetical protein
MEEIAALIPNGAEVVAFIVALFALVAAFVPDSKWPGGANGIVAKAVNFMAFNFGKAKNDPRVN